MFLMVVLQFDIRQLIYQRTGTKDIPFLGGFLDKCTMKGSTSFRGRTEILLGTTTWDFIWEGIEMALFPASC